MQHVRALADSLYTLLERVVGRHDGLVTHQKADASGGGKASWCVRPSRSRYTAALHRVFYADTFYYVTGGVAFSGRTISQLSNSYTVLGLVLGVIGVLH